MSGAVGAGGYEYEFVDAPPDRVVCKICHSPCRDAQLTGCCGARFCSSCLAQLKNSALLNKSCPICRADKFKSFPDKSLNREIKALHVYCENRRNGCTWCGEMIHIAQHIKEECQFVEVLCPSKCGMKLKRQSVQLHLVEECPCYCHYCGKSGNREWIAANHKKNCYEYPMPCPNGCQLGVIPSGGMATHKRVCPLEPVKCEYYDLGCKDLVARGQLPNHYEQKMATHLTLMKSKLVNVVGELEKAEKKATTFEKVFKKDLEATKKDLGSAKRILHNTKCDSEVLKQRISTAELQTSSHHVSEQLACNTSDIQALKLSVAMHNEQPSETTSLWIVIGQLRGFNFSVLYFVLLFTLIYVTGDKKTSNRFSETEKYTWPLTLDYLSNLSLDSSRHTAVPFTYKINMTVISKKKVYLKEPLLLCNFTFSFNGIYESTLIMEMSHIDTSIYVSLKFQKSITLEKTMFTIEFLNQVQNSDHHILPILVNFDKTCESLDDSQVCKIYCFSKKYLTKNSDHYLKNGHLYFRISETRRSEILWYVYKYCGHKALNMLLDYKTSVMLGIITFLIMRMFASNAWLVHMPLLIVFVVIYTLYLEIHWTL